MSGNWKGSIFRGEGIDNRWEEIRNWSEKEGNGDEIYKYCEIEWDGCDINKKKC